MRACFASEVEVLTRDRGVIRCDEVREVDWLASRSENDATGPVEYKPVEEAIRTQAVLWHLLLVDGGVIRTTEEHAFWAEGRGWTATKDLCPGEWLNTLHGERVTVGEVKSTT